MTILTSNYPSLDIQIPCEQVFEPPNISWGSAFRGSKHLLTKYLQDFGCLGLGHLFRAAIPRSPQSVGYDRCANGKATRKFTEKLTWHLKMDGWNTSFLLGWPSFRGYVSFRKCSPRKTNAWNPPKRFVFLFVDCRCFSFSKGGILVFSWCVYTLLGRIELKQLNGFMKGTLSRIIMVQWKMAYLGSSWKVTTIGDVPFFSEPYLWEEGYSLVPQEGPTDINRIPMGVAWPGGR